MSKLRGFGVGALVFILVLVIYFVLNAVTKKPEKAYDFSAGTQHGQVISLSDNYGKCPTVLIFIDPQVEGSTDLLSRIIERRKDADIIAMSISTLSEEEQKSILSEDILGLDKLCFESSEAVSEYNIGAATPITYFIDQQGYVQEVYVGAMRDSSIEKCIDKIS